ncbi:metal ABC transporter permease [Actinospica sp.]|jgi:zinc/manganese transport system permease protein|uniref:metal ABC transporter permease n=1 Tax=Actinospica sp. TaxID=1872142 RepID=UPI002CD2205A|nr:metal ABC transporter permease [Actinospica sp.]HWG28635.1 metal ABC transporter permease [Actinospica sp.]
MPGFLQAVFEPGFFASGPVHAALLTGAVVALISGAVGVFTVLRSQSFAGHSLADLGTLGGSGAFLFGIGPLWGFISAGIAVGGAMDLAGSERRSARDVSTGIVLGAVLGLSALLLYFDTTSSSTTGVTITVLFGSLFAISGYTLPATVSFAVLGLGLLTLLYRPLLLSSVSPDLAAARGVRIRLLGLIFMITMGITVALASLIVGTILSPALLIGPAATALRLTRRPMAAMAIAGALGTVATWLGVLLAYDSYHWPPVGNGWPVSFFVITLIFAAYLGSGVRFRRAAQATRRTPHEVIEAV